MERDELLSLLTLCETKLRSTRREIDTVLETLDRSKALIAQAGADDATSIGSADAQRDELVRLVIAALGNEPNQAAELHPVHTLLHQDQDGGFRIGRRQIGLTEMESRVLKILWDIMPASASRQMIHGQLYSDPGKVTEGAVDVFVSKLRQKLRLAGGGEDYLRSLRGKGWVLRGELCDRGAQTTENTPRGLRA